MTAITLKTIDKNIKSIKGSADKLNALVHTTGLAILAHASEHGDCTRALALVKAMPASFRKTMLVAWFTRYSPIRVVEANDKVGMLKPESKQYSAFNIEGAAAEPFYAMAEKEREVRQPTTYAQAVAMLEAAAKRVGKLVDDGLVNDNDADMIAALVAKVTRNIPVLVETKTIEYKEREAA